MNPATTTTTRVNDFAALFDTKLAVFVDVVSVVDLVFDEIVVIAIAVVTVVEDCCSVVPPTCVVVVDDD